jgi:putative component of membrane protein insertase Oxa1/YidC/SpoIIIJ protein YidD
MGSALTAWRILRCNPWSHGGIDEVKPGKGKFRITKFGFVLPLSIDVRKAIQ